MESIGQLHCAVFWAASTGVKSKDLVIHQFKGSNSKLMGKLKDVNAIRSDFRKGSELTQVLY